MNNIQTTKKQGQEVNIKFFSYFVSIILEF